MKFYSKKNILSLLENSSSISNDIKNIEKSLLDKEKTIYDKIKEIENNGLTQSKLNEDTIVRFIDKKNQYQEIPLRNFYNILESLYQDYSNDPELHEFAEYYSLSDIFFAITGVPTAATDGKKIAFNPVFFYNNILDGGVKYATNLAVNQNIKDEDINSFVHKKYSDIFMFILTHEIFHQLYNHFERMFRKLGTTVTKKQMFDSNVAQDAEINRDISQFFNRFRKNNIPKIIGGVYIDKYDDKPSIQWEQIYDDLVNGKTKTPFSFNPQLMGHSQQSSQSQEGSQSSQGSQSSAQQAANNNDKQEAENQANKAQEAANKAQQATNSDQETTDNNDEYNSGYKDGLEEKSKQGNSQDYNKGYEEGKKKKGEIEKRIKKAEEKLKDIQQNKGNGQNKTKVIDVQGSNNLSPDDIISSEEMDKLANNNNVKLSPDDLSQDLGKKIEDFYKNHKDKLDSIKRAGSGQSLADLFSNIYKSNAKNSLINWRTILKHIFNSIVPSKASYTIWRKRIGSKDLYGVSRLSPSKRIVNTENKAIAQIFYLIDNSGSMYSLGYNGQRIFIQIFSEILKIEKICKVENSVACFFNSEPSNGISKNDLVVWNNKTRSEKDILKKLNEEQHHTGGTDIPGNIEACLHLGKPYFNLIGRNATKMIVFTDGEDNLATIKNFDSKYKNLIYFCLINDSKSLMEKKEKLQKCGINSNRIILIDSKDINKSLN